MLYPYAAEDPAQLAVETRNRQRLLESMFQYSPAAIAILRGPGFIFELVNPAYQALAPGEPMAGRTVAEVWPEAAPLIVPLLEAVRENRTVYHADGFALPLHRGPGSIAEERHFDLSYVPLGEAAGDTGILVIALEVTDHRRAAAELRGASSELAAIHANTPVALLVVNEDLRVDKVSDFAAHLSERQSAALLGLRPGGALGCERANFEPVGCGHTPFCGQCALHRAVVDTIATREPHENIEAWLPVTLDGHPEERCLLISTTPVRFDNATKVLVCAQDITDRKGAERELRFQAQLINHSHDAIITADAGRVINGWNQGAEELYGWREADATSKPIHDLLHTTPDTPAEIDLVLARDGRWEGELQHTRRNGQQILVDSRQVLLRNPAGSVAGILEINRDITARRATEQELQRTVRELESALADKTVLLKEVHHRVKNNLAVISSLLQMKGDVAESAEAREALAESQRRVHSMALIHEHLYGNDHLDRIDFSQYVRQLVQEIGSAFGGEENQVRVETSLVPIELGVEQAVPCALILNELVTNAFKYAFPGGRAGRILVSLSRVAPDSLELSVEDDGVGLPEGGLYRESHSLGFRIVRILARQLDSTLEQQECAGTRVVLRFSPQSQ